MIGPLLYDIARRGTLRLIDAGKKLASVQVSFGTDDERDCELFQQYGFTSSPLPGAEGIGLAVGGGTVVIAIDDRRYRLTTLDAGEVALYDHLGSSILLQADGKIVINSVDVIELGEGATEALVKGDAFQTLFNGHTHGPGSFTTTVGSGGGGGPVSGASGAPTASMDASHLSAKVKVI
tara:strand:- start:9 stop:545 length:537 start_codon:yes stop_codon:yes gene_type:complete